MQLQNNSHIAFSNKPLATKNDTGLQREWDGLFSFGNQQARKLGIKSEKEANRFVERFRKRK